MHNPELNPTRCTISEECDGATDFLFQPADNDLFIRTGRQVIEHCRLGISVELWMQEVKELFSRVVQWCNEQQGRVRACYAVPGAKVTLFVVPSGESYDFELGAELADLNVRWVQTFNVGMIETRQIPWAQRDRFIDPEASRRIYGDPD